MLGWWTDEMKGYRLEDVETWKLLTLRDVMFVEDDQPMDMAVIEGDEATLPRLMSPDLEPSKAPSDPPTTSEESVKHVEQPRELKHTRELPREVPKNGSTTWTPKMSKWADLPT
jgi:hypothetical protein